MGGESPIGYIAIYSPPYREGLGGGSFSLIGRAGGGEFNSLPSGRLEGVTYYRFG